MSLRSRVKSWRKKRRDRKFGVYSRGRVLYYSKNRQRRRRSNKGFKIFGISIPVLIGIVVAWIFLKKKV